MSQTVLFSYLEMLYLSVSVSVQEINLRLKLEK